MKTRILILSLSLITISLVGCASPSRNQDKSESEVILTGIAANFTHKDFLYMECAAIYTEEEFHAQITKLKLSSSWQGPRKKLGIIYMFLRTEDAEKSEIIYARIGQPNIYTLSALRLIYGEGLDWPYSLGASTETEPNQALEPTTLAVTLRAPSRTDRAS